MSGQGQTRYRQEVQRLIARRGPIGGALFTIGTGVACVLEYYYNPSRLDYLLLFFSIEVAICVAATVLHRFRSVEHHSAALAQASCIALLACVTLYVGLANASGMALALVFAVSTLTAALIFPWGARGQMPMAAASVLLYGAYVTSSATSPGDTLPAVYGLYAVAAGAVLSVVGAALLDRQRFAAFTQSERLDQQVAIFQDLAAAFHGFDPQRVLLTTCVSILQAFNLRRLWAVWQAPGSGGAQGCFVRNVGGDAALQALVDPQPLWDAVTLWKSAQPFVANGSDARVPASLRARHVTSLLCIPLEFEGERLGALCGDRDGEAFETEERDLALASALASSTVIAMANARLYQQATAASEEKSTFLARVAHELRNPLHACLWDIDTLRAQPDIARPELERLRQNALMTLDLARSLQEFAEVETRQLTAQPEPLSLPQLFADLEAVTTPLLKARPLELHTHVERGAETLVADPFRLRQVLGNLLSNAAKFTARGRIDLEACRTDTAVVISVRDTGCGIDAAELPQVFTPFYRGSTRPAVPTRSMGLGLAIAQEIAALLGGRIEVESTAGVGSTFRLLLTPSEPAAHPLGPLEPTVGDQPTPGAAAREAPAYTARATRAAAAPAAPAISMAETVVLLVEDDEDCRAQTAGILRRSGAVVVEAADGIDGLRRARERMPDVVVVDLALPGLGGIEVLSRLKNDERRLAAIPVIIVTAQHEARLTRRCCELGCAGYLVKPYTAAELLTTVATATGRGEQALRTVAREKTAARAPTHPTAL
jgi:signal transduction histidine kinase/CheY-like chemotaxis protein